MSHLLFMIAMTAMSLQAVAETDKTAANRTAEQCIVTLSKASTDLAVTPGGSAGTITENMKNLSAAVEQITTMVEGESPEWAARLKERVDEITRTTGQIVKTAVDFGNRYQKQVVALSDSKATQLQANLAVELSNFEKVAFKAESRLLGLLKSSVQFFTRIHINKSKAPETVAENLKACFQQTQCARNEMFEGLINLGVLNEQLEKYVIVLDEAINNITQVEQAIEQQFRTIEAHQNTETQISKASLGAVHTTLLTALRRTKNVAANEKRRLLDIHDAIKMERLNFQAKIENIDKNIDGARDQLDKIKTELLLNEREDLAATIERLVEVLLGLAPEVKAGEQESAENNSLLVSGEAGGNLLPSTVVDSDIRDLVGRLTDENYIQKKIDEIKQLTKYPLRDWEGVTALQYLADLDLAHGTDNNKINEAVKAFWLEYAKKAKTSSFDWKYIRDDKHVISGVVDQLNRDLAKAGIARRDRIDTIQYDSDGDLHAEAGNIKGDKTSLFFLWSYVYSLAPRGLSDAEVVNIINCIQAVYKDSPEFKAKPMTLAIILKRVSAFTDEATWKKVTERLALEK